MRIILLYTSETWVATKENVFRHNRSDLIIMRWMCSAKLTIKMSSDKLRSKVGLCNIKNVTRCGRLHWYVHLQYVDPELLARNVDETIASDSNPRDDPGKHDWNVLGVT